MLHPMRSLVSVLTASLLLAGSAVSAGTTSDDAKIPHYDHVIVIVEENKAFKLLFDHGYAPHIAELAAKYGVATQMYAETHPSEPNYVALIGGDTFGIHDDDAWYCTPAQSDTLCKGSSDPGFVAHLIDAPNLASQLRARGLAWRAYLEDLPAPGSLAILSPETDTSPLGLYSAKHTGFTNFASVHKDPDLSHELVGFDAWKSDIAAGNLPSFSLVIPNMCNEMHGLGSAKAPADCNWDDPVALVRRGDAKIGTIMAAIMASPVWTDPKVRTAVVITFDEDDKLDRVPGEPKGCCVSDAHNPGGGHIPTIVITNHGPRGVADPTPYNHYSLLRTIEDALGLNGHVGHADDATVVPMVPLFGPVGGRTLSSTK
jgi:phospholipase C